MCKSIDGELITESSRVLERWAQHFEGVLNGSYGGASEDYELPQGGPDPLVSLPTLNETKDVISTMKNNKAPGIDLITAELIKLGGNELHKQIHDLIYPESGRRKKCQKNGVLHS